MHQDFSEDFRPWSLWEFTTHVLTVSDKHCQPCQVRKGMKKFKIENPYVALSHTKFQKGRGGNQLCEGERSQPSFDFMETQISSQVYYRR